MVYTQTFSMKKKKERKIRVKDSIITGRRMSRGCVWEVEGGGYPTKTPGCREGLLTRGPMGPDAKVREVCACRGLRRKVKRVSVA